MYENNMSIENLKASLIQAETNLSEAIRQNNNAFEQGRHVGKYESDLTNKTFYYDKISALESENTALKNVIKKNAYERILNLDNDSTYGIDEHGDLVEIFKFRIVKYIESCVETIDKEELWVTIKFSNRKPLIIKKEEYKSMGNLLHIIEKHLNLQVSPKKPRNLLTNILSNNISNVCEKTTVPLYVGWGFYEKEGTIKTYYDIYQDGKTSNDMNSSVIQNETYPVHLGKDMFNLPKAKKYIEKLSCIENENERALILLLVSIGSLFFHLSKNQYNPIISNYFKLAICLYCNGDKFTSSKKNRDLLSNILTCSWDNQLKLNETPKKFREKLILQKDTVILIRQDIDSEIAKENMRLVSDSIETGTIQYKTEKTMMGIPVLVTRDTSQLQCMPTIIPFDIHISPYYIESENSPNHADHFRKSLVYYTLEKIGVLYKLVDTGKQWANTNISRDSCSFSDQLIDTIGTIKGVYDFIADFISSNDCDFPALSQRNEGIFFDWFIKKIESHLAYCSYPDSAAKNFINLVNEMLIRKEVQITTFEKFPDSSDSEQTKRLIISDGSYIYMKAETFNFISNKIAYSSHDLKESLRASKLLYDTNENSYQTRSTSNLRSVSTENEEIKNRPYYYKFSCSDFKIPSHEHNDKSKTAGNLFIRLGNQTFYNRLDTINFHAFITGISGSGKSYALKKMVAQMPSQNCHVLVFNVSGDKWVKEDLPDADWTFIDVESGNFSYNPLYRLQNDTTLETTSIRFTSLYERIFNRHGTTCRTLEKYTKQYLATEKESIPSVQGLLDFLLDVKDSSEAYKKVVDDIEHLNSLKNCGTENTPLNLNEPGITVLNIEGIGDDNTKLILIETLMTKIRNETSNFMNAPTETPIIFVFDECQHFRFDDGGGLKWLITEGRKRNMFGWFASQSYTSQKKSLGQVGLKLFFNPDDNDIPHILKQLPVGQKGAASNAREILNALGEGEFIFRPNKKPFLILKF